MRRHRLAPRHDSAHPRASMSALLACALLGMAMAVALAGCAQILGIEDLPDVDARAPDARPGDVPDARPGNVLDADPGAPPDAGGVTPPDAAAPPTDAGNPACSQDCSSGCTGGCCTEVCDGDGCTPFCDQSGCDCRLDCNAVDGFCFPDCLNGAICDIDCTGVNNCEAGCRKDSQCAIDCDNSNNCGDIECESGAECLLRCGNGNNCGFSICDGAEQSCAGNILVCNRACP
jgi:hypothetical protein